MIREIGVRGQILPIWIFGALMMLGLIFFGLDYGNMLQWQIRAQSAADAAAAAALAPQNQTWNAMTVGLYASSIEEYRIRALINAMEIVAYHSGGCVETPSTVGSFNACPDNWQQLQKQYIVSVSHLKDEIGVLNRVMYHQTLHNEKADAQLVLDHLIAACDTRSGLDCAFGYKLTAFNARTPNLHEVSQDSLSMMRSTAAATENTDTFAPAQAEVVVCHNFTPLISQFFGLNIGARRLYARSAATSIMVNTEWIEPGYYIDPASAPSQTFQPPEFYGPPPAQNVDNWYWVPFGYADYSVDPLTGIFRSNGGGLVSGENDRFVGWWSSAPVAPFGPPVHDDASLSCAS